MIGGIYESPLTIRALIEWRKRVEEGEMPLRDIIDLDTTYNRLNGAPLEDQNELRLADDEPDVAIADDDEEEDEEDENETSSENGDAEAEEDDDLDDLNMSLAAMEDAVETMFLPALMMWKPPINITTNCKHNI